MKKQETISIQNLFNGDLTTYTEKEKALDYVKLCIERQIPLAINYGIHYVN